MKKKKVLQVCSGENKVNGVESFLINYDKYLHDKFEIDILFCFGKNNKSRIINQLNNNVGVIELDSVYNGNVFDFLKLYRKLKHYLQDHFYDIIHINTASRGIILACVTASHNIVPGCLVHAHNTRATKPSNFIKKIKWYLRDLSLPIFRQIINAQTTGLLACSNAAGQYMFGKNIHKKSKYFIVRNAIELNEFKFDYNVRNDIRYHEKISEDELIFGHIGRFSEQKNPLFLIDIFYEFHRLHPNSLLWMIGEGELRGKIEEKIKSYSLEKSVCLFGSRNDIQKLMQAMDVFIFPSLFEGLSIVMIEAQASGLPIFASDSISDEHKVSDSVFFIPLKKSALFWAKEIENLYLNNSKKRFNNFEQLRANGYELSVETDKLNQIYKIN